MKTQELKNKKSFNLTDQLIVISFPFLIIFSLILLGMVLTAGQNIFSKNRSEKPDLNSLNSIVNIQLAEKPEQAMEFEKLEAKMVALTKQANMELLMAKIQEYLVPEKEPEISFSALNVTKHKEIETVTDVENEFTETLAYGKNEYLEKLAREKYREVLEFYALEKKIKEFLVAESEPALLIEDWMKNEKCWCTEPTESFAHHHK